MSESLPQFDPSKYTEHDVMSLLEITDDEFGWRLSLWQKPQHENIKKCLEHTYGDNFIHTIQYSPITMNLYELADRMIHKEENYCCGLEFENAALSLFSIAIQISAWIAYVATPRQKIAACLLAMKGK